MADPPRDDATEGGHFEYFMVRVRVDVSGSVGSVGGVVERLGTGQKRTFGGGEELLRLIADWSRPTSKMQAGQGRSNE